MSTIVKVLHLIGEVSGRVILNDHIVAGTITEPLKVAIVESVRGQTSGLQEYLYTSRKTHQMFAQTTISSAWRDPVDVRDPRMRIYSRPCKVVFVNLGVKHDCWMRGKAPLRGARSQIMA